MRSRLPALLAAALLAASAPLLLAQQRGEIDLSGIDPALVLASAEDVMMRAPDRDIDALYQAVRSASESETEARTLCALFDPDADRSLLGMQRAASALGPASQERFVGAVAAIAVNGTQGQRQPYDAAAAEQVLKQAGVTAMLLHDGFMTGMAATGSDPGSQAARCRSFRQLVDVLQDFTRDQRAAATRFLLLEGLTRYGSEL
ncbi:hypothetical protein H0E84_10970 [Luteimonas sp. SJ-92]|uniref:Uncharacterized protein n=1 Tax=Luteimonas salinisoli TaxID=2752307 RepID=A0A853JCB9_9GAMM|nr:hypothetical protein [Luteimonas salinisoli]NZA26906.1 hypothetical protein [Luteimonas salinisoli]